MCVLQGAAYCAPGAWSCTCVCERVGRAGRYEAVRRWECVIPRRSLLCAGGMKMCLQRSALQGGKGRYKAAVPKGQGCMPASQGAPHHLTFS